MFDTYLEIGMEEICAATDTLVRTEVKLRGLGELLSLVCDSSGSLPQQMDSISSGLSEILVSLANDLKTARLSIDRYQMQCSQIHTAKLETKT